MRSDLIRRIDMYLESCFPKQTPPHVNEIALQLGMTRFTLGKKFRALYGVRLSAYFKHQQIACAKHLLAFTRMPISVVARHAAFHNAHTFRGAFRRVTGMSPRAYRKACRKLMKKKR